MSGRYAVTPIAHELARNTELGRMCSECGAEFTEAHGRVTACEYCWKRLSLAEQNVVHRATHPETNKEAHRREARTRKRKRNG